MNAFGEIRMIVWYFRWIGFFNAECDCKEITRRQVLGYHVQPMATTVLPFFKNFLLSLFFYPFSFLFFYPFFFLFLTHAEWSLCTEPMVPVHCYQQHKRKEEEKRCHPFPKSLGVGRVQCRQAGMQHGNSNVFFLSHMSEIEPQAL